MRTILASTSPRRKELMKETGIEFEAIASNYEEDMTLNLSHKELAMTLAYGKAKDVAEREEGLIIGGDTFVTLGNKRSKIC